MGVEMMVVMIVVVKLSLLRDNMVTYVENSMEFVKILLKLRNEFNEVIGHKINIQKSYFIYLQLTIEIKIIMSLHSMKNMKYLGMILTKDV